MRVDDNAEGSPNFWPNSLGGPGPDPKAGEPRIDINGPAGRYPYTFPNDDFVQPGNLYRKVMRPILPLGLKRRQLFHILLLTPCGHFCQVIFSTLSKLVDPVTPTGSPPVITTRSPDFASPSSLASPAPAAKTPSRVDTSLPSKG